MSKAPDQDAQHELDARIATLLADVWQRNQPEVLARLALLDEAAAALKGGTLAHPLREQAIRTAHNLAGTLGMFGQPRGTEIARQLEAAYDADDPNMTAIQALTEQLRQILHPV